MRVVSFSLFGDNPLYLEGALENLQLCSQRYPDWEVFFYIGDNVPGEYISELRKRGARIVPVADNHPDPAARLVRGSYWRFLATDLPTLEVAIFRDCDSRILDREVQAVHAWISSGKDFHFMYDHPLHTDAIMAGMWGVRAGVVPQIKEKIRHFFPDTLRAQRYADRTDQRFLYEEVWKPLVRANNYLAHGSATLQPFHRCRGTKLSDWPPHEPSRPATSGSAAFVGEVIQTPHARPKQERI